uniref:Vexin n=1 Tax=Sciurus vulgaris TaxID=55149 RepID=A0A8D2BAF8_SCIVU
MHQIYSCSDENIQVFTTVIPSKASSPARIRVKSSQHLLTKNMVIESDLYTPRPLELLPHHIDHLDASEGHRFVRLQNARPPRAHPAKTPARPVGISEPKASNLCGNQAYGKSLIPPVHRTREENLRIGTEPHSLTS